MSIYLPDVNSEEYEIIFTNVETKCGIVLRSEKGPIACKKSQLIYIIIALLWKYIKDLDILPKKKLEIEKKKCDVGYTLDKNYKCTNIEKVSKEINDIIDEIQNSRFNFAHIEKICDIVYDSYDIISKYEQYKKNTHFFDNIKDYMNTYLKLGWKNYNYHYSRIFENYDNVNIRKFITFADKYIKENKSFINKKKENILFDCIGGYNALNDKYGNFEELRNLSRRRF